MVLILRFLRKMSGVGLNSEVVFIVGTSMHYTPTNTSISIHPFLTTTRKLANYTKCFLDAH